METKIFSKKQIPEAVELLKKGELVAFQLKLCTVLVLQQLMKKHVKGVYAAKGRPSDNP